MPRHGLKILALGLALAACGQNQTPQQPGPSAAPPAPSSGQAQPAAPSAAPPGFAGAPYAASRTYFKLEQEGPYTPAWFLCDGIDRGLVMAFGLPDAKGDIISLAISKKDGAHGRMEYRLGQPDPGAGQVYWPLTGKAETGYLRAFNPGMIDNPASATTPTFTEVKLGEDVAACRWAPNTLVEAASELRSYLVTREAGQLVYRTFNYDQPAASRPLPDSGPTRTTSPSLEIHGGTETTTSTGKLYAFENNGYRFTIEVGDAAHPKGAVTVTSTGRQLDADPFDYYTVAR